MVRDDEINRLIRYAQGMGVSVRFKPYVRGSMDGGGWTIDGSEINVFVGPKDTKLSQVLVLIHELGHHRGFIENGRKTDPKVEEALLDEEEKKKSRKRIYLDEVNDTQYWEQIYKDTDCKFPIWRLNAAKEFDIWWYEEFYKRDKSPSGKEMRAKYREIKKRHRNA